MKRKPVSTDKDSRKAIDSPGKASTKLRFTKVDTDRLAKAVVKEYGETLIALGKE